jgi:hypothetical protein
MRILRRRFPERDMCMPARIALRKDQFQTYCKLAGLRTDLAIAEFLDVDATMVGRVRRDLRTPGNGFIAAVIAAFAKHCDMDPGQIFDALFDVTEDDEPADDDGEAA